MLFLRRRLTSECVVTISADRLYRGDCLKVLQKLEDNSIDSIVTDPPYGLGFMGKFT